MSTKYNSLSHRVQTRQILQGLNIIGIMNPEFCDASSAQEKSEIPLQNSHHKDQSHMYMKMRKLTTNTML